mgnify:FL=1|tara:strand:+ start:164 stop:478 length:315 start_codon:yes stop_codon:yes gene_type:complete
MANDVNGGSKLITKHEIIRELYDNVGPIIGNEDGTFIVKDEEGKSITIDPDAVDAEFAKQEYKNKREVEYPYWGVQLDYIYHNGIEKWKTDIVDPVKKKYPKPS